jgi:hypothetical protein
LAVLASRCVNGRRRDALRSSTIRCHSGGPWDRGAFNVETQTLGTVGAVYPFQARQILNLDASEVVTKGNTPSGAHSDIFYSQLAWVAAAAGGLNR